MEETGDERRKRNARERSALWRKENPERVKQLATASRRKRKEKWDEFLAQERARYRANPTKRLEKQKAYRAEPRVVARQKAYQRDYAKQHSELYAMRCAIRKSAKLKATPVWCDLDAVEEIYRRASQLTTETGIRHEVDHIVPLQGKNVCGLHIPQNLQILTITENRRKANRLHHGGEAAHQSGIPTQAPLPGVPHS